MRSVFLFLALAVLPVFLSGGVAEAGLHLKFDHLTMDDGLPESGVLAMLQDRQGFLWFGTLNGLVRYDGYSFKTFKPDPDEPGSFQGRIVLALHEDGDGRLWIGSRRGGLALFDSDTETFTHYLNDPRDPASLSFNSVTSILEDRSGALWVGTGDPEGESDPGGLNRLDRATGRFERFLHDPTDPVSLSDSVVTRLHEDGDGVLWIGTAHGGLCRFDPASSGFACVEADPDDPRALSHPTVNSISEDPEGHLWIGTAGGLNRLDRTTGAIDRFLHDPENGASLAHDIVYSTLVDSAGSLWVGTHGGTLHRHGARGGFYRYAHDPDDAGSLAENPGLYVLFEDRTGILWAGSWDGGLNKLDRHASKFPHYRHDPEDPNSLGDNRIRAIHEDRAGSLWIGTGGGGLDRYHAASDTFTHFRHDPESPGSLASDWVTAIGEDRAGTLWVGTEGGLHRFDPATGTFARHRHDPGRPDSLSHDSIRAIHQDASGALWIGTSRGLNRMEANGAFTRFVHDPADPATLANDSVRVITEDRDGTLWFGTLAGLSRFDPATETFTTFVDPATGLDIIFDLVEDSSGRIWAGTLNAGLHLVDRETGASRAFTRKHGLAHDAVFSIVEDGAGRLWLSTGNGLSRFDPETRTFRNYDIADGLQGRRFDGGAVRTRDGELLFGGSNGINAFYPGEVEDSPDPPAVVLTTFKVFHQPVVPGAGSPLARHISRTSEVVLPHDQNMITLGFAGLHYGRPDRNRHSYRLEPLEREWNDIGSYRYVTYTRLAPGEYLFRVKAANSDGVWNEEGASLRLTILPPWWRTGWAYALYALLAALLILAADRFQRRRLLHRERERAREEKAQLRAEAAEAHAQAAEAQAKAMQAEYTRTSRELEDARQLQLAMLPEELPDHPEFEIAAFMKTATEVGGDYYDFDVGADGMLTVAIGDATGHGTRAGTMVAATKVLFKLLAGESDSLEVLRRSTRVIKRMNLDNMFMALALARVVGGHLEVAGAGMPPTLVRRACNGKVDELGLEGAPLGSFSDFPYRTASAEIGPGDVIVLMSDGLPEMLDPAGEVLGYERVTAALSGANIDSPKSVIDHLSRVAEDWAGGRVADDDLTLVVLRRKVA